MSRRKIRPAQGTPVTAGMSLRDVGSALGTTKSELARWCALAEIPNHVFEQRLAEHRERGQLPSTTSMMFEAVPARGRVQRAYAIFTNMSATERTEFLDRIGGQHEPD